MFKASTKLIPVITMNLVTFLERCNQRKGPARGGKSCDNQLYHRILAEK
jgi:hypothetical protein